MNYPDPETVPPVWEVDDVILEKYEVKQVFMNGGMGLVYRVYHREWDTDLAVKSPRPEFFQSSEQVENFEREAETWINLGLHPNIVSCYYVRRLGGIPRIFAEFIEGGSLSDWIRSGRLYEGGAKDALERIIDIAIQSAWGLHYAHEQGHVHQDVKPANILMLPDGTAKVSDFGLSNARKASAESRTDSTRAGQSILVPGCGYMTREYASPEQLRGDLLSRRSDIYSWAVSLLEMLVGELTWTSGLAAPIVAKEFYGDKFSSDPLAVCIERCLRYDVYERIPSIKDSADLLLAHLEMQASKTYARVFPKSESLEAWFAHNRALSLIDIKGAGVAINEIREVARKWPHQVESQFVELLLLWRLGKISGNRATELLNKAEHTPLRQFYLGLLYRERGAIREALKYFEEGAKGGLGEAATFLDDLVSPKDAEPQIVLNYEMFGTRITASCILFDNSIVLTGDGDGLIRAFLVETGELLGEVRSSIKKIYCIAAHPQKAQFAVSGAGDKVEIWDATTLTCILIRKHNGEGCASVIFDRFGVALYAATLDGYVRRWEVQGDNFYDLTSEDGKSPIIAIVFSLTRNSIVALRKNWTLLEWRENDQACTTSIVMPKLENQSQVAGHVGRPQMAAIPGGNGVLVSNGYKSAIFDLELLSFTHFYSTSGWVTGREGVFGASCKPDKVLLYDCQYGRLWELPHALIQDDNSNDIDIWYEAPAFALDGRLLCYCACIRPALRDRDLPSQTKERIRVVAWNIERLAKFKNRLISPFPLIKPVGSSEYFIRKREHDTSLNLAKEFLASNEPVQAISLIEAIFSKSEFSRTGEAHSLRWKAGREIIRDKLISVASRASQHFADSFMYIPDTSSLFIQSVVIDDSTLFEMTPDDDGEHTWAFGYDQPETELFNNLCTTFGAFGMPKFLGFDPVNNSIYLNRRNGVVSVYLPQSKHEKQCVMPSGTETTIRKALRNGSIMMIGQSILSTPKDDKTIKITKSEFSYWPDVIGAQNCNTWECDCTLSCLQSVLIATANCSWIKVFDGLSRRYKYFQTESESISLFDLSLSCSLACFVDKYATVFLVAYPSFQHIWCKEMPIAAASGSEITPKILQFSCDEKLLLVGIDNCIFLLDAITSDILWRWEDVFRDAFITIDSRFLIILKETGFDCFELEWSYRVSQDLNDWKRQVRLIKIFLTNSPLSNYKLESSDTFDSHLVNKIANLLKIVGWGNRADIEIRAMIQQAKHEDWRVDDLMIFDDFEAETGQAAFPFFWERDYSKLNL